MSDSRGLEILPVKKWLAGVTVVLVAVGFTGYFMSGYREISPNAYQYARSLYTICNQRDSQRLEKIVTLMEADVRSQKISEQDRRYLMRLVQAAEAGDWQKAQESIRKLLEVQVKT